MYEHVYYRKKDVRARLLSSKKMYEHVYRKKDRTYELVCIIKKCMYRKKDVRARLLS